MCLLRFNRFIFACIENGNGLIENNNHMKRIITLFILLFYLKTSAQTPALFPVKHDGKWGYINSSGSIVIQPAFDAADYFENGLYAKFQVGYYTGLLDTNGSFVIQPVYDDIRFIRNNLFGVHSQHRWSIIQLNGKTLANDSFDRFSAAKFNFIFFVKDGKSGAM